MESQLIVVTSKCGLLKKIEKIQMARPTKRILPSQDIWEVRTKVSFQILVTNVLERPVVLHKYMGIGMVQVVPECILLPHEMENQS